MWIDLHALIMNNFERRVLHIERINTAVQRCASRSTEFASQDAAHKGFCWAFPLYRPSSFLEQFRTESFLRIESTAVQRCAHKADSYGNEKLIRKWTKPVFFIRDQKLGRVELMATVLFRHGFDY